MILGRCRRYFVNEPKAAVSVRWTKSFQFEELLANMLGSQRLARLRSWLYWGGRSVCKSMNFKNGL